MFDSGRLGNAKIAQAGFSHDGTEGEGDFVTGEKEIEHKKSVEHRETSQPSA